jgi:hypothetical protein
MRALIAWWLREVTITTTLSAAPRFIQYIFYLLVTKDVVITLFLKSTTIAVPGLMLTGLYKLP